MAKVKVGKYGDVVGGKPLGYGETDWYKKIGQDYFQDQTDTPATPASPGKVGDVQGGMPLGYNPNDIPAYLKAVGTPIDTNGNPVTPTNTNPNTTTPAATTPTTPAAQPPQTPASPTPVADLTTTPVGDTTKLQTTPFGAPTSYISSFDPALEQQQNASALESARLSALPGLQDALAQGREDAARASGGQASGMYSEMSRKPLEKFGQTLATKAADLQTASLQRQYEDNKAKSQWQMEQDVKQNDWIRTQTSNVMGADYAQALSDKEWQRNNTADVAKENITIAFQNKQISQEDAWKQWSAVNDNYQKQLDNSRQDLLIQQQYAEQEKMFDKSAALQKEIANIDAEQARANMSAQQDSSMWGGVGGIVGNILGGAAIAGKLFGI